MISSGEYIYFKNGERQNIVEPFTIEQEGANFQITSYRHAQDYGVKIIVNAYAEGIWHELNEVTIVHQDENNRGTHQQTITNIGNSICYPLLRVFTGPHIEKLSKINGTGDVLIPSLAPETLLEPQTKQRQATYVGEELETIDGEQHRARVYDYLGDQYRERTQFYLNEDGLLLAYTWQENEVSEWRVELRST